MRVLSNPTIDNQKLEIVVAYRGIPHARGWALGASLARAFRRLGHHVYEYGNYYRTQEPVAVAQVPQSADLLVYCECNDLDPQYTELRNFDAQRKVYWDFDINTHPTRTLRLIEEIGFSHVFFGNIYYEDVFHSVCDRVRFLPIAFDEDLHKPQQQVAKEFDIGLCGSPYRGRLKLIRRLREAGLNAVLVQDRYAEDYVRTLNSFKISLNYGVGGGKGLIPGRVWESIGCGTLLLADRRDLIDQTFVDMRHLALFSSFKECVSRAEYLLAHPDSLRSIAGEGHRFGLEVHTYIHRAQAIIEAVVHNRPPTWDINIGRAPITTMAKTRLVSLRHRLQNR